MRTRELLAGPLYAGCSGYLANDGNKPSDMNETLHDRAGPGRRSAGGHCARGTKYYLLAAN
jgi:hypothetical protein